jgi:hypothetical protein
MRRSFLLWFLAAEDPVEPLLEVFDLRALQRLLDLVLQFLVARELLLDFLELLLDRRLALVEPLLGLFRCEGLGAARDERLQRVAPLEPRRENRARDSGRRWSAPEASWPR